MGRPVPLRSGSPSGENNARPTPALELHAWGSALLVCLTIVWGAFTAGMDAGLVYNDSFPLMGGQWIPPDMWHLQPAWLNVLENHGGIQFTHRWLAVTTSLVLISFWGHAFYRKNASAAFHMLGIMALVQPALGIATLFTNVSVFVAATHQAGALVVFALLVVCLHHLRRGPPPTKITQEND